MWSSELQGRSSAPHSNVYWMLANQEERFADFPGFFAGELSFELDFFPLSVEGACFPEPPRGLGAGPPFILEPAISVSIVSPPA